MVSNSEVAEAWGNGRTATAANFFTDGSELYSYRLRIGETIDGKKVLYDYTKKSGFFKSMTTSRHVGLARQHCDELRTPPVQSYTLYRQWYNPRKVARY